MTAPMRMFPRGDRIPKAEEMLESPGDARERSARAWRELRILLRRHRGHVAIDNAAHSWTRIVPIRSGKVVFAGWKSNCGGYQVWVSHGNGLYSAYYHMSRENSYRGEWVSGGSETIGWVGSTGCATGPHLHIEVWRGYPWRSGSYRVNPWGFIDNGYYLPYRYR